MLGHGETTSRQHGGKLIFPSITLVKSWQNTFNRSEAFKSPVHSLCVTWDLHTIHPARVFGWTDLACYTSAYRYPLKSHIWPSASDSSQQPIFFKTAVQEREGKRYELDADAAVELILKLHPEEKHIISDFGFGLTFVYWWSTITLWSGLGE